MEFKETVRKVFGAASERASSRLIYAEWGPCFFLRTRECRSKARAVGRHTTGVILLSSADKTIWLCGSTLGGEARDVLSSPVNDSVGTNTWTPSVVRTYCFF